MGFLLKRSPGRDYCLLLLTGIWRSHFYSANGRLYDYLDGDGTMERLRQSTILVLLKIVIFWPFLRAS